MELTPYLQLRDRLSQVWLNKNTIILVLMAVKLALFAISLKSSLETAKYYTLNSCPTIDNVASNVVSLPHYLSKSANYMLQKSVEEMNTLTVDTITLMLTGAEEIIIFALETVIGTYACVLVSAIDGAVDVAVNSTESIISWVNDTLADATDDIEDGLTDLSDVINKIISAADKIEDFFDGDDDDDATSSMNKVNLTVSALRNLAIPSSVNSKLEELKDNTPDFDTVKNKTEGLIREPFDYVKSLIANRTIISSDDDGLYVPSLQDVPVCSNNTDSIEDFYDDLSAIVHKLMIVFVTILVVGAVAVIMPVVYSEVRKWRRLQNLSNELNSHAQELKQNDPITVFEETFNRYPTKAGVMASKISSVPEQRTSIRWFMSYIFSSRASIVLGLSLAGFAVIIAQSIILAVLEKAISGSDTPFSSMTNDLTSRVSDSINNWTDSTNDYLSQREDSLNEDLFSWVKTTTDSVNDTISAFVDDMNDAIADAFNGTILYDPVKTIVGCVIENKLIKIEEGLTWVYDNAEITLPRVSDQYLSLAFSDSNSTNSTTSYSNSTLTYSNTTNTTTDHTSSELLSKTSTLVDDAEEMMSSILKMTMKQYRKGLMVEVWIATSLLVIWLAQLFIGAFMAWSNLRNAEVRTEPEVPYPNEKMGISYPRALTRDEQRAYGYPYSNPFKTPLETAEIGENPFLDPKSTGDNAPWRSEETISSALVHEERDYVPSRVRQSSFYSSVRSLPESDMVRDSVMRHFVKNPFDSDDDNSF